MTVTPELCRAARALLNWSQQDLATRAQVARRTIADFETGNVDPHPRTLRDVAATLHAAGIDFLPPEDNVSKGGVRLRLLHASELTVPGAGIIGASGPGGAISELKTVN